MKEINLKKEIIKEVAVGCTKATLGLIPVAGPYLVEAFFDTPDRLASKRREEYIDNVLKKLLQVQESMIDIDYLKSEEFSDLFQHIVSKIVVRRAKERADFFARLSVINTLKNRPLVNVDWQFQFIDILADLNDSEMLLLNNLYLHPYPAGSSVSGGSTPFGLDKSEFQLCFDSLFSKGLVYDASLIGLPKLGTGTNPAPRERINISPLGKKIVQFTKDIDAFMEKSLK